MTEAVFAFRCVAGFEPATLCWQNRRSTAELYTKTYGDVLPLLLSDLLDHLIQHAAFLSSRELLRSLSRLRRGRVLTANRSNCALALSRENFGQSDATLSHPD